MLTGGAFDDERRRLFARSERLLGPLHRTGLNVFPVLTGRGGDGTPFQFAGVQALGLRGQAIDAFFTWLAENLETALRVDAPGQRIGLTPPRWAVAG
jgi:hypothetical protein